MALALCCCNYDYCTGLQLGSITPILTQKAGLSISKNVLIYSIQFYVALRLPHHVSAAVHQLLAQEQKEHGGSCKQSVGSLQVFHTCDANSFSLYVCTVIVCDFTVNCVSLSSFVALLKNCVFVGSTLNSRHFSAAENQKKPQQS